MVLIGSANGTRFSYIEYQALMLSLAGGMALALTVMEVAMTRFHALPFLFPSLFTVHDRAFFIFNYDISNGRLGKQIRSEAKMLIRMALCLLLSYLWQHCGIETAQLVTDEFPRSYCTKDYDCFSSEMTVETIFTRSYEAIDCSDQTVETFESRLAISCIHFVTPTANNWLKQIAIAHSLAQLNIKCFELSVWIAGGSKIVRRFFFGMMIISGAIPFFFVFSAIFNELTSSWLGFVMSLAVPVFFHCVWRSSTAFSIVKAQEDAKIQSSIQSHLDGAFQKIEDILPHIDILQTHDSAPSPKDNASDTATNRLLMPSKHLVDI